MRPTHRITQRRSARRLGLTLLALAFAVGLTGCDALVNAVQHRATVTVTGLPASGQIAPGEGLPNLNIAASLATPVDPEAFGRLRTVEVVFKYTRTDDRPRKVGPYTLGSNLGSFKLPADAKPGTTVDMVTTVKSQVVNNSWGIGVSYAEYTETSAQLKVTGGDECPAPASTQPAPEARLFAAAAPMSKSVSSSVDARGSTDPQNRALTYSWDLNGDCTFGDEPDATEGQAVVQPNSTSIVRVRVSTTDGGVAQASVPITWADLTANARITSPTSVTPGFAMTVIVAQGDPSIAIACLDDDRDGVHDVALDFSLSGESSLNHFANAASTPGYYSLSATMWKAGTNAGCANTGTSGDGLVQIAQSGYRVIPFRAARQIDTASSTTRQGSARQYVATSTLRLKPKTNPVRGTVNQDGVIRGTVTRGTFTFRTPARAGKAKRPAGLGDLVRGTYVARAATSTVSGTGEAGKAVYTGQSTVLLRGRKGTLACVTVDASIASSDLTMRGGTKAARRLVFTATQTQTPFTLPTVAEFARQQSAKKPPKAKPVNGKGPITASTGKKARGLNGTCKSLRKYLR